MTRKKASEEKRRPIINAWAGIYRREYEMYRAYGFSMDRAMDMARLAVKKEYDNEAHKHPQDKMFFLDVRIDVLDLQGKIVSEVEQQEVLVRP
jgi:hypothetical protein